MAGAGAAAGAWHDAVLLLFLARDADCRNDDSPAALPADGSKLIPANPLGLLSSENKPAIKQSAILIEI